MRFQLCIILEAGHEPLQALPKDVDAGHEPPEEITAVVCPASFTSANASKNLDQEIHHERKFCDDSRDQI